MLVDVTILGNVSQKGITVNGNILHFKCVVLLVHGVGHYYGSYSSVLDVLELLSNDALGLLSNDSLISI